MTQYELFEWIKQYIFEFQHSPSEPNDERDGLKISRSNSKWTDISKERLRM